MTGQKKKTIKEKVLAGSVSKDKQLWDDSDQKKGCVFSVSFRGKGRQI